MMPAGEENFLKHGFSEKDIKYITGMYKRPLVISSSGKLRGGIIAVLDKVLSRVEDFKINIFFGEFSSNSTVEQFFFNKYKIPKDHIVFLKKGSSGDLLTPWMILHTMAHAAFQSGNKDSEELIYLRLKRMFVSLSGNNNWNDLDEMIENPNDEILSNLFNFASARSSLTSWSTGKVAKSRLISGQELVYEIFVSYLYGGGKLKRPTGEKLSKLTKLISQKYDNDYDENYISRLVDSVFSGIEEIINEVLESCRGKVIAD
jgi:hypothetical protein